MIAATSASLDDGVLLWQVACEYLWASCKPESRDYSYADALADIGDLRNGSETALPTWGARDRARSLKTKGLSHRDALLIGACLEAGVDTLISEDFREIHRIDP